MNKNTYGVVREEYAVNGETRISYGIAAYYDINENGSSTIVSSVHDVSSSREEVENLVKKCNESNLLPEALVDILE